MKAVNQFKRLLCKKHPERIAELFSEDKRLVQVPGQMHETDFEAKHGLQRAKSKRQGHSVASSNVERGVHEPGSTISESLGEVKGDKGNENLQTPLSQQSNNAQLNGNMISDPREASLSGKGKGQARDPMDQAPPWLGIGAGAGEDNEQRADVEMVADSPMAADFNIYDTAYQKEVERIRRAQGQDAKIYLTRRVDREAEGKGMRI
jgi:[calcium/calmodulin-dependent protein kinase] kinase